MKRMAGYKYDPTCDDKGIFERKQIYIIALLSFLIVNWEFIALEIFLCLILTKEVFSGPGR